MASASIVHRVGKDAFLACDSADRRFLAAFEDDGRTAYFYGGEFSGEAGKFGIVDALHVYNVDAVVDKEADYPVEVRWAATGHRAGLFIEGYCHAVFDFDLRRAVCRSGFPPASGKFAESHDWDEKLLEGL
jgi:hypothetical protein